MNENKLKPCPFCGFRAFLEHHEHRWFWIRCGLEDCAVNPKTKGYNKKEYAIEMWNRRVNDEQATEL